MTFLETARAYLEKSGTRPAVNQAINFAARRWCAAAMAEHPYPVANKERIAVVGSGIAGLTAAHLLSRKYAVTIFEREPPAFSPGRPRTTVRRTTDIPLRVFSEAYYPSLCKLYRMLGVRYHAADYSVASSVRTRRHQRVRRPHQGDTPGGDVPGTLPVAPGHARNIARLLLNWLHFLRHSPRLLELPESAGLSLASFGRAWLPERVRDDLLLPMLSVVARARSPPSRSTRRLRRRLLRRQVWPLRRSAAPSTAPRRSRSG